MNKEIDMKEKIITKIQNLKKNQQILTNQLNQLENQRQQMTAQILAISGAIQELESLLQENPVEQSNTAEQEIINK